MKWVFTIICFCLSINGFSQDAKKKISGLIIGNVIDSVSGSGLPGATIQMTNSTFPEKTLSQLTDKNGAFEISDIPFGFYRIIVSASGLASITIDSLHVREERYDFNLGDILLKPKLTDMQEVVIYAEKPLIESKDGKIIYNVGESALSAGASTSELLKNMPLISNDADGKILLKGKEPKILIDDKPTELNAEQLADLLESLPGNVIERIEVMSNPPPQYASESGGVINIITKKGQVGFTGRINTSYGTRGEASISSNISYRGKKFSITVTAGAGAGKYNGNGTSLRENFYKDSSNYFETYRTSTNKSARPNARVNAEYDFNKRNQLNLVAQISTNLFDNGSETNYKNLNRLHEIYKWSVRGNGTEGNNVNPSLTGTYTYKGKNPRESLRMIASVNTGSYKNERDFNQQFLNPDKTPTGTDSVQRQKSNNNSNAWSLRLNYDKPVTKNILITAGAYNGRSSFHNVLATDFLKKPENIYVEAPGYGQDFRFYQTIYNARVAVTYDLGKKWRMITGIQAEHTEIRFSFTGTQDNIDNKYVNWLPNFTIRKEWEGGWNSSLVYRKSIRRPGINELNPSIDFNDPYNLRFGNPQLLPQLADNFDWNGGWYKGKMYVNASLGYNYVTDIIQSIRTLVPGDKTQVTYENIMDRREYEASLWGGYTFSKKLRVNTSVGYSYNQYSSYDRIKNKYRNGSTVYTTLNYRYTFSNRVSIDGNVRYNSISDAQGRSRSNITQNIGLQTKWLNKRLIVSANLIDFISRQQYTKYTYGSNFILQSVSSARTKNLRLSVAYNLTKPPVKLKAKMR